MNPSNKRKRSIANAYRPPITPHTAGSKNGLQRTPSRASRVDSIHAPTSSARQPRTPLATETQPPADSSEDDYFDQVIASIDMKDFGTVGCAYYSTEEEKLYLLGDSRSGGTETIEACKLCDRKKLGDD